jgi:flap endonuclease-1
MGIPWVEAPCEAEAECAALCRAGKAYATATEDMDALAHATPILLRHLSYSAGAGKDVISIEHATVLAETGLTQEQFVDFCILCGCDYCDTIRGIGPTHAFQLIQEHGRIEGVIAALEGTKYTVPEQFDFVNARELFFNHQVTTDVDFQWTKPDQEGLIEFLVTQKGFSQVRIENVCKNLNKARESKTQMRLDSFFTAVPTPPKVKAEPFGKKPPVKKAAKQKKKK